MIIQQDSKKKDKKRTYSPEVTNVAQYLTYSSQFESKIKKNIIKIHLPLRNIQTSQKKQVRKKWSHIEQTNYSSVSDIEQQKNRSKSTSFKPSIEHKKTYSNARNLLQVFHKKYRAKTITQKFYTSNYELNTSIQCKKGFKGGKLADYSLFKNMKYHKIQQKGSDINFQPVSDNSERCSQQKIDIKFVPYVNQQFKRVRKQISEEQRAQSSLVNNQIKKEYGKYHNKFKVSSLNASLNLYRKKFNQMKKNKIMFENKLMHGESHHRKEDLHFMN